MADLDIPFGGAAQPQLITTLLQTCTIMPAEQGAAEPEYWALTVGERTAGLLEIAANSGITALEARLRCLNPDCEREMEVSLPVQPLLALQPSTRLGEVAIQIGEVSLTLRKPTGADQLEWQRSTFEYEEDAVRAAIRTLTVNNEEDNDPLTEEQIRQISVAMQQADPLVNFTLELACPYCEESHLYEIDLPKIVLAALAQRQKETMESIHQIAQAYHWGEETILSLSPVRRARYLALIERGEAQ